MSEPPQPRDLSRLPRLRQPQRYQGLYIVDFGDAVAVGYTAGEVATLYASGRFEHMRTYRIHRALPDGTLELAGVGRDQFTRTAEEGFLFLRRQESLALADFAAIRDLIAATPLPCPVRLEVARIEAAAWPYATVLIFSPLCVDDVTQWLIRTNYRGGDQVEMGFHRIAGYRRSQPQVLDELSVVPASEAAPRTLDELLAARHEPVQR